MWISPEGDRTTEEALRLGMRVVLRRPVDMGGYRAEGTVKAWLCGIARHVCVHTLETRRKQRELLEVVPASAAELLEVVPASAAEHDQFAIRRRSRAVREGLAKLKPTEREALVLRYVADLSHREIALACNLDEPTARKRISRALARLRSVMPEQEIE